MKEKISVEQKCQKEHPEFCGEVAGLSVEELNSRIAEITKGISEAEDKLKGNEEVESLRNALSEILGPLRDAKKAAKLKTKYIISLIKEKGGSV
jgi:uncharacterized small protein (DUF1192 family)